MKKLLKWTEGKSGTKLAYGDKITFAYQKQGKHYRLIVDCFDISVVLTCKTERDCLIISNLLNKV